MSRLSGGMTIDTHIRDEVPGAFTKRRPSDMQGRRSFQPLASARAFGSPLRPFPMPPAPAAARRTPTRPPRRTGRGVETLRLLRCPTKGRAAQSGSPTILSLVTRRPQGSAGTRQTGSAFWEGGLYPYDLRCSSASGCGKRGSCGVLGGRLAPIIERSGSWLGKPSS